MNRRAGWGLAVAALLLIGADWDKGGGIFGEWVKDQYGLVAYQYEIDEVSNEKAQWKRGEEAPSLMWHQIGNLHINAIAANHGFVQLFYNDSAQRWVNFFNPEALRYAGGFGFVLDGDTAFTTYYPYAPREKYNLRRFGQGYFEKELAHNQLLVNETVFAPAGDLSALVMRVELKNLSDQKKQVQYVAYFDVNPMEVMVLGSQKRDQAAGAKAIFAPEFSSDKSMVIARSKKLWGKDGGYPTKVMGRDPEYPDIFLASLNHGTALAANPDVLFTTNGFKGAAGLKNLIANPGPVSGNNFSLFNAVTILLAPGEEKVLHFAYGYAKAEKPASVIAKIGDPEQAFSNTIKYWQDERPVFTADQDQYLSRELEWNHYYVASSFLYDGYYNRHFAPQGGHYLYNMGVNGATRDLAGYTLGLIYFRPDLAREMIELCLEDQETSGRLFYDFEGYGKRYSIPYRPSDLSLWILWAATEYVFATRDFDFLKKELPYWPKEKGERGTVSDHLTRAYEHLEHDIGLGRHELIQLRMSDWNDQMTLLVTKNDPIDFIATFFDGESALNSAMACYILPQFSALLTTAGDGKRATEVDAFYKKVKAGLQKQWLAQGWYPRAYSALGKSFGRKDIFLEPQVWALLSDNLMSKDQQDLLLNNIEEKLRKPSKLGMLISSDTKGSLFAKPGEQERGGIWFAINGPGAYALAKYRPETGYDELKKNTLAWHGAEYPQLWYGIWSGPDSFNSVFSDRPGQSWIESKFTGGPMEYPVQNNNAHADMMWGFARMAGFNATAEGYRIEPLIPLEHYKLETPLLGLEKSPDRLAGYFVFTSSGWMTLSVKPPKNLGDQLTVLVNGAEIISRTEDGVIKFPVSYAAGKKVVWQIKNRD